MSQDGDTGEEEWRAASQNGGQAKALFPDDEVAAAAFNPWVLGSSPRRPTTLTSANARSEISRDAA